ncbi:DUF5959 family protein [Streptomyces sp. NPDC048606]|uniref:DUF5959 family protein n=1 Tax=Streptomyces sp. NPDC048606 TaxID=3154726 RepID=UPI00343C253A
METPTAPDLIHLSSHGQSVSVTLAGLEPAYAPDDYAVDIVIASSFVNARLYVLITPDDLDHWAEALDRIEAHETDGAPDDTDGPLTVDWPPASNDGYLRFIAEDPYVVEVRDAPQSGIVVRVPLDLGPEWITEARQRIAAVRELLGG